MKYSSQFKLECVKKHKNGERGFRSDGKGRSESFLKQVGLWAKHYDKFGMDGLRHSGRQRNWTAEERFGLVCKVLSGLSLPSVASEARANPGQPFQWVEACREKGMIGLDMESGRKRKKPGPGPGPERAEKPVSEAEELALLRERNRFLEIENAYLKKIRRLGLREGGRGGQGEKAEAARQLLTEHAGWKLS